MTVTIVPCLITEACEYVLNFHRHNDPPQGSLFAVGASDGTNLVGVAIVGRPIGRLNQGGTTAEVTRCCVVDDAPKGTPSALYGACWRAAKALGWRRLITTTLQSESGASLRGAGWKIIAERKGNNSAGWQSRPGRQWQSVVGQAKFIWQAD
jgi:hypothetical protein